MLDKKVKIIIPDSVQVESDGNILVLESKLGRKQIVLPKLLQVKYEGHCLVLSSKISSSSSNILEKSYKSILTNHVVGLDEGFSTHLILRGIGYRVWLKNDKLYLKIGKSHLIEYDVPKDVDIFIPRPTILSFFGIDKAKVFQTAAEIRRFRPPESYKEKGFFYPNERKVFKEGKKS